MDASDGPPTTAAVSDRSASAAGSAAASERTEASAQGSPEAAAAQLVYAAEVEAEDLRVDGTVLGTPGPPINRRSPFMVGLMGAAGVAVTYVFCRALVSAASILALIGLSLFLAVGLEPAVAWLTRMRLPRGLAVATVAVLVVGVVGGFLAAAVPLMIAQVQAFIRELPTYVAQMKDNSTTLGHLDARFHLQDLVAKLSRYSAGPALTTGLLNAGRVVRQPCELVGVGGRLHLFSGSGPIGSCGA